MTPSELKYNVEASGKSPYYFTRKTMRFWGDTMRNYGVRGPYQLVNNSGEIVLVMELYRKNPVKNGIIDSAFFNALTWSKEYIKQPINKT